jgi:hypothetical protein
MGRYVLEENFMACLVEITNTCHNLFTSMSNVGDQNESHKLPDLGEACKLSRDTRRVLGRVKWIMLVVRLRTKQAEEFSQSLASLWCGGLDQAVAR